MFKIILRIVAILQIVLGLAYLFVPGGLLKAMGHSVPPPDLDYPLAMLASRFLVYGAGLWMVSNDPTGHRLWVRLMAVIQLIDLGAGIYYTATDVVPLSLSAVPMFNAVWIGLCMAFLRPGRVVTPG